MSDLIQLSISGRVFRHGIEKLFEPIRKKYKLRQIELEIVNMFGGTDVLSASRVCSALDLNKGHVSQAMFNLCLGGYIRPEHSCADRRLVSYRLTEAGERLLATLQSCRAELERRISDGLDDSDIETFNRIVEKMLDNAKKIKNTDILQKT